MRLIPVILSALLLVSCGEVKRLDTSKIKEQMGNYKVKQIRPDEMMSQVRALGEKSELLLNQNISCSDVDSKIDSLNKIVNGKIEIVDVSLLDLGDIQDDKEKMLYDAYLYAYEQGEKLPSNAQKLTNGTFVYSFGVNNDSLQCDTLISPNRYFWKLTWSQEALIQSF